MGEGLIINPLIGLSSKERPLWGHPLKGGELLRPSSDFGAGRGRSQHGGIDYSVKGAPVYAPASGQVLRARFWRDETGLEVAIRQSTPVGAIHEVMHLERIHPGVKEGGQVEAGQLVGWSGNTGFVQTRKGPRQVPHHLHWQTRLPLPEAPAEARRFSAVVEQYRGLSVGLQNHPLVLVMLHRWLTDGDYARMEAELELLRREGPAALPALDEDRPVVASGFELLVIETRRRVVVEREACQASHGVGLAVLAVVTAGALGATLAMRR